MIRYRFQNLSFGCIFVLACLFGIIYVVYTSGESEDSPQGDPSMKLQRRMREAGGSQSRVYPVGSPSSPKAFHPSPSSFSQGDLDVAQQPDSKSAPVAASGTSHAAVRVRAVSALIQRMSPQRKADLCAASLVLVAYIIAVCIIFMRPTKSSPPDYFA